MSIHKKIDKHIKIILVILASFIFLFLIAMAWNSNEEDDSEIKVATCTEEQAPIRTELVESCLSGGETTEEFCDLFINLMYCKPGLPE